MPTIDGPSLLKRVNDLVTRVEMLAMRLANSEQALAKISSAALPTVPVNETADRDAPQVPPSSKKAS
jgi:hypothetical protein